MSAPPAETLSFEGHASTLTVLLFTEVKNSKDIRRKVIGGEIQPEFAFINAETVEALFGVHLAGHRALTAHVRGKLTARSLHAELVFNLAGSKHIGESLKRFGISDDSTSLLVARFDATPEDVDAVSALVLGTRQPVALLSDVSNPALVTKYYKITADELSVGSRTDAVATRIGSRDCI